MSTWAYLCRSRPDPEQVWYVSRTAIHELPEGTLGVLVRVGRDWIPAIVDRSHAVTVEAQLLRDVIADLDCVDETPHDEPPRPRPPADADHADPLPSEPTNTDGSRSTMRKVTAAAISRQGQSFVIVLVGLSVASVPGEADLVIADLQPRFGGVPVILMGQEDDGTPVYYGRGDLTSLLDDIPVDRLPWKEYPLG